MALCISRGFPKASDIVGSDAVTSRKYSGGLEPINGIYGLKAGLFYARPRHRRRTCLPIGKRQAVKQSNQSFADQFAAFIAENPTNELYGLFDIGIAAMNAGDYARGKQVFRISRLLVPTAAFGSLSSTI